MKKRFRLLTYSDFQKTIKHGTPFPSKNLVVFALKNDTDQSLIGIRVSKKNGKAVVRNKIKRQIRAIVDKYWSYQLPITLVIIARPSYNVLEFPKIEEELKGLLIETEKKLWKKQQK